MDWHARETGEVLQELLSDEASGLTQDEAVRRLARHGPNRLPEPPARSALQRFLLQFHDPLIYVLVAAAAVTLWLDHRVDAAVILGVVVVNAIIGFVQEGKAERALEAVRAMLASRALVLRDGERHEIDAQTLVPGDIVLLESGSRIPADLRLLRVKNLRVGEAALTGESVPVEKDPAAVAVGAVLADRRCMGYSGTVVAAGQARAVVVATGEQTEIGRIGRLVAGVEQLATPLTRRLAQFGRRITAFVVVLSALTFLYGLLAARLPPLEVFLAVVGLAVAAIPEGLPAIVTITLAIGTGIMARRSAIVRRLPAVEALGSVSVICSDKTGTLTRNEMTAAHVILPTGTLAVSGVGYAPDGGFHAGGDAVDPGSVPALLELARAALRCNDARLAQGGEGWELVGDPTEGALLALAMKAGLDPAAEAAAAPRVDEIPFESEHRFMATLHHDHARRVFVELKGAPERVLALARAEPRGGTMALAMSDIDCRFTLLGMVGMIDPPRPEAMRAVAECRSAGIRVMMITGDHAGTAAAIGRELGLDARAPLTGELIETMDDAALRERIRDTDVIARASPEHKQRLVAALQADGQLVAMTGDGVNDAPALRAADVGVAMGLRGTDAAKEAADLVLTDDNFASIARAVREGRTVFDNIKKSLLFILPTNGGEAGVILLAIFAGLALPVTAAQILWINMVTTITLALALAFEPAEPGVMRRPPRAPREPLVTRILFARIVYVSLLMVAVTLAVYEWELARGSSIETARTAAVNMLVLGEMVYLFNVRHFTASALARDTLLGNRVALWACLGLVALQLLFTYLPPMQALFHTRGLDTLSWLLIGVLGVAKFLAVEAEKWAWRRAGVHGM